ncbi:15765_t:CDS:2, partial [Gigaspora margarita]
PQLLSLGEIIDNLHYGPFCSNCFVYENDSQSQVYSSISMALSTMYQKSFLCKTHISEPTALEFDNNKIICQLLLDIKFIPFYIQFKNISILIANLEAFENIDFAYAEPNYLATFTKKIEDIQQLIVQNINNKNKCTSPIEAWQQMTFLQNYNRLSLFGLEDSKVQQLLQQTLNKKDTQLKCNIMDWDNFEIIKKLFEKHLCQIFTTEINWYQFFTSWKAQKSTIIELISYLLQLYLNEHSFTEHEYVFSDQCYEVLAIPILHHSLKTNHNFSNSLDKNKKGFNGKRRVLSIIAKDFSPKELHKNLK